MELLWLGLHPKSRKPQPMAGVLAGDPLIWKPEIGLEPTTY
jgi:hypothetical protein